MESKFNYAKKGYNIDEVNNYIKRLEEELDSFKSSQTVISQAIVHAENTAQRIIDDAHLEAQNIHKDSKQQLDQLKKKIKYMRMKLDSFQSNYNQLIHKYIISMNNDDFHNLYTSLDKLADTLDLQSEKALHDATTSITTRESLNHSEKHSTNDTAEPIINLQYEKTIADY